MQTLWHPFHRCSVGFGACESPCGSVFCKWLLVKWRWGQGHLFAALNQTIGSFRTILLAVSGAVHQAGLRVTKGLVYLAASVLLSLGKRRVLKVLLSLFEDFSSEKENESAVDFNTKMSWLGVELGLTFTRLWVLESKGPSVKGLFSQLSYILLTLFHLISQLPNTFRSF